MGKIVTKRVFVGDQEVVINVSDFNPEIHKEILLEPKAETGEPELVGPQLHELTADEAKELIVFADEDELNRIEASEKEGKNRSTVMRAIERRRNAL